MDNQNNSEQTIVSQPANADEKEANNSIDSQVNYGKFDSLDALVKAYGCLESEFTRKCQRLKEIEQQASESKRHIEMPPHTDSTLSLQLEDMLGDEQLVRDRIASNEFVRSIVIAQYLQQIKKSSPTVVSGRSGHTILTQSASPRSLKEAKLVADMLINQD